MNKLFIAKAVWVLLTLLMLCGCKQKSSADVSRKNQKQTSAALPTDSNIARVEDGIDNCSEWFKRGFSGEKQLLASIRTALAKGTQIDDVGKVNFEYDPSISWTAVTIFQAGHEPIRWISKRPSLAETLNRVTSMIRKNNRFADFDVADPAKCRIMLEVVTVSTPLDIDQLSQSTIGTNRFEPGITGFHLVYENRNYIYMPTEAMVESHLSIQHVLNAISKKVGVAKQTNRISERIDILMKLPIKWSTINSVAFVTYGDEIIPLYRGHPFPIVFSRQKIYDMAKSSVDWVYQNMTDDGEFLYYYDGVSDTVIDHAHPGRSEENNYYNILRHSGGIVALLRMYELTGDKKKYLTAADKACGFLIRQLREQTYKGTKAYYVFYNKKAKLGGTGIGLVALVRYYQASGDPKYNEYAKGMANHLISRITDDGEMIGYYIHPLYKDGQPILEPTPEERKALFSFYYPGEALMGLALFEREIPIDENFRHQVKSASAKALDFLVKIRPVRYADLFKPLPSDGWLMQAIEEWSYDKEFHKPEYLEFVFTDARQMISHMYNRKNSLYCDYPGTFFYEYGDHAYVDGARAEGLIAAYYLAQRLERAELANFLLDNCKTVATSLMYSYNGPESTFMHKYPEKSIGSFRFKFTRHWVRVDTAQHTACFFTRLVMAMDKIDSTDSNSK